MDVTTLFKLLVQHRASIIVWSVIFLLASLADDWEPTGKPTPEVQKAIEDCEAEHELDARSEVDACISYRRWEIAMEADG